MLPLDLAHFNRYHHGAKANMQDVDHLRLCVSYGRKRANLCLHLWNCFVVLMSTRKALPSSGLAVCCQYEVAC